MSGATNPSSLYKMLLRKEKEGGFHGSLAIGGAPIDYQVQTPARRESPGLHGSNRLSLGL